MKRIILFISLIAILGCGLFTGIAVERNAWIAIITDRQSQIADLQWQTSDLQRQIENLEAQNEYYESQVEHYKYEAGHWKYYLYKNWDKYIELKEENKELRKGIAILEKIIVESRKFH